MSRFGPVVTAMITPMRDDGSVNYEEAQRLALWLSEHGSTGLVVAGSTGESATLTDEEKIHLFRAVVEAAGKRAHVIANSGGNDTRHSVELSRRAVATGVHGVLVVAPYYNKPPQSGLVAHFTAIADAVETPMMIYNIPGRTGVNVLPETVAQLAQHPRIVAIKESSGDLGQIGEVAARVPEHFDVYSGDDHLALPTAAVGGCGVVSVASHVAGSDIRTMFDAFAAGNARRATEIHRKLLPLFRALFTVTNPIPVKAAMALMGFHVGRCRLPLVALSAQQQQALFEALAPWIQAPALARAR